MSDDAVIKELFGDLFTPPKKGFAGNVGHNPMHLTGCACDSCQRIWDSHQYRPELNDAKK